MCIKLSRKIFIKYYRFNNQFKCPLIYKLTIAICIAILTLHTNCAIVADDFLYTANNQTHVHMKPNKTVKWVYNDKYIPVKILVQKDKWYKIQDMDNDIGWIINTSLTTNINAAMIYNDSIIYSKPLNQGKPIALLSRSILISIDRCWGNWCKIKYKNYKGWIEKSDLWGVNNAIKNRK